MRIVIADDASVLRSLLRRLLADAGHAVVAEVADAQTAFEAVLKLRPDALIVDGRLPPSGALAVLETLAHLLDPARPPAVYVIAALSEVPLVRSVRAAGAAGVILRPLHAGQIAAAFDARRDSERQVD